MGSVLTAWPVIVFGAPLAIIGLLICVVGLMRARTLFLVTGSLALAPSALYLGAHSALRLLLLLPLLPLLAAVALHRDQRLVASLLLIPNLVAVLWIVVMTLLHLRVV